MLITRIANIKTNRLNNAIAYTFSGLELWRIPDWARISSVLDRHRDIFWHFYIEKFCIICRPARFWYLDHPHVIKRALVRIKIGIDPMGGQQRITDCIGVRCISDIDGATDRCLAAGGLR